MKYWLISDTHFNHTKLEEWGGRSGDWGEKLMKAIQSVPEKDTLIHLGDICIGDDEYIHHEIMKCKAKKILVLGNHDKKSISWYYDHGWDFVCEGFWLTFLGRTILFSHRPMHPDMWRFSDNIHGHTHGNLHRSEEYISYYEKGYHIDISPELTGFKTILLDHLIK